MYSTVLCGTRIIVLLSSIQPPVILHCAGKGGFAGVADSGGLSSLLQSPGVESSEAYWMKPICRKPVGSPPRSGIFGVGPGMAAGVGHGTGFRLWADDVAPKAVMTRSSSTTPATLKLLIVCSNPLILKLLPSCCNLLVLLFVFSPGHSCIWLCGQ
jgi:hypothetical protein